MKRPPEVRMLSASESEALLIRAAAGKLTADDVVVIRQTFETLKYITDLLHQKKTQVKTLLKRIFGIKSEKSKKVQEQLTPQTTPDNSDSSAGSETENNDISGQSADSAESDPKEKPKGHGRYGIDTYSGAEHHDIFHSDLVHKDRCPECLQGKVYQMDKPGVLIHFEGQPSISATVYRPQKLRCNLCGEVFTAELPNDLSAKETDGSRYYDPSAKSIMAILRYGSGMPLNRISELQKNLGIPLAVSTIWDKTKEAAQTAAPAFEALRQLAAQGSIIHNDDTSMKVLETIKEIKSQPENTDGKTRSGIFTTGIVSFWQGQKIALFITGRQHAGENFADLLGQREAGRAPPIQMCDAKSGNTPKDAAVIISYCNTHARRKFVDVAEDFPDQCLYVITEVFGKIYEHDAEAKHQQLSDVQRLRLHQLKSKPVLDAFYNWLNDQFEQKWVEPNSSLGKAINYVLTHWDPLTRFLHVPGVPLDNNICERALKKAILHRRNSLFYKTSTGAQVGDMFMSLIHTCKLAGANPFDYLTQLQIYAEQVRCDPSGWLPWNYTKTVASLSLAGAA
jgi:transposase